MNVTPTSAVVCFAENATHLMKQMKCLDEKQIRLGTGGLTMAEYINREELLKDIDDSVRFSTRNEVSAELRGAHKIVDCIRSAPACDVVKVVRCKDCKNWGGVTFGNVCSRWSAPLAGMKNCTQPDDFCSYGERRSENENTRKNTNRRC
jgi:hypothetical protein